MPALALLEDRLEEGARLSLGAAERVVYVVSGRVEIDGAVLEEHQARHAAVACAVRAHTPARLWRWELRPGAEGVDGAGEDARGAGEDARGAGEVAGSTSTLKLRHAIELPQGGALMRADRVDFPPRGIAYTHTHQGPGIRVLLRGRFRVQTGGHTLEIGPGEPWFERGPDPVYAESTTDEPTSFVRVMVLPVALLGKSSIRYVKPEDQARPKSQTYTVFVDAPLTLGSDGRAP